MWNINQIFCVEHRGNTEEEQRQKNILLEQKKKDLEKLQYDLQGLHKRTTELHSEEKRSKEQVAEMRFS